MKNKLKFYIKTFGCKVNQYESQRIANDLISAGFKQNKNIADSNIVIINACTVTHKADREARRLIRKINRENPSIDIMVAGCLSETDQDRKELDSMLGVKWVIRNRQKDNIVKLLKQSTSKSFSLKTSESFYSANDKDRVFIKVQDGCDYSCSYCKTSIVRGNSISRKIKDITDEINKVVELGYQEIVLTGICLGLWGKDINSKYSLCDLLKAIIKIKETFRIRLSSIEPMLVTDELLDLIAKEKRICRHLHVPMQNGDDKILKAMNRHYTSKDFLKLVQKAKKKIKGVGISTDIIVGFPGENEDSFKNTVELIKKIKPIRAHIFTYSKRKGTKSYEMKDQVASDIVKIRHQKLSQAVEKTTKMNMKEMIGKTYEVLIESQKDRSLGLFSGYTDTYIRVYLNNAVEEDKGKINNVVIKKIVDNSLYGDKIN